MTTRRFGCAALIALLSLIGDARAAPTLGGCPVFPANNYWNTPVDSLPVHASSATWVSSSFGKASWCKSWTTMVDLLQTSAGGIGVRDTDPKTLGRP